jgi:hypothetical protein
MSAIARKYRRTKPTKVIGVSSVLCGLPWTFFCALMMVIVSGEVLADGFRSSVDELFVNVLFLGLILLFAGLPGAIGIWSGVQLLREPTINRIRWATTLVVITGIVAVIGIPADRLASGLSQRSVEIVEASLLLVFMPVGVWVYAKLCNWQARSLDQSFYRPIDFLTRGVLLVTAFFVWMTSSTLLRHAVLEPGESRPVTFWSEGLSIVSAVIPIAVACAFYFYAARWVERRHRESLPPSLSDG